MGLISELRVGLHRPVYLWAGPGTIRMNRLKFMGAPVDEGVHLEAHTSLGAARAAQEAGFNWAYLMYDWGFAPEIATPDWKSFQEAVHNYRAAGMRVLGYIQTSNCVFSGSYQEKDWYALDPRGRKIYYYTGRFMTCWLHPEWQEHLRAMVRGVLEAGAQAVFFDNPWHAGQPLHFFGAWLGGAGCYCNRCQAAFKAHTGLAIPTRLAPERDNASRLYLRWRVDLVTRTLAELAAYARHLKSDVMVSANNFDAVMRPSYLIYGIDLAGLAGVQDLLMIEDYGLPRWQPAQGTKPELLVNNALTLRTARALAGDTPVTTNPYDKGIGFDDVYPARRFQQGMAEAAACGAPMVVKGTEFVADGLFTLLTAERYLSQRQAIGQLHHWLAANNELYTERRNLAPIGLLHPGTTLWHEWKRLAPAYFGTGQILTAAGVPWRVITTDQDAVGLQVLLTFGTAPGLRLSPPDLRTLNVLKLPGWDFHHSGLLERYPWLVAPLAGVAVELFRAYFHSRLARHMLDRLGLAHFFLLSPFFQLPATEQRQTLLAALGRLPGPRLHSQSPVLVEWWEQNGVNQLHLVNYAPQPQTIRVEYPCLTSGTLLIPGKANHSFTSKTLAFDLDVYAIILSPTR